MTRSRTELTQLWSISLSFGLDLSFSRHGEKEIQAFSADIDNDGKIEYCIQRNDSLLVLNDHKTVQELTRMLFLPVKTNGIIAVSFLKSDGHILEYFDYDTKKWEVDLSYSRFGVGFHRHNDGSLEFGGRYFGHYRSKPLMISLGLIQREESDESLITVLHEDGMFHLLDLDGNILDRRQLMKGVFDKAKVVQHLKEPGKIILSFFRTYKQKWLVGKEMDYEWHSVVADVGSKTIKILGVSKEISVLFQKPSGDNEFLDHFLKDVRLKGDKLHFEDDKNDIIFGGPSKEEVVLRDPRDRERFCRLKLEPGRNQITVSNASNCELWNQVLDVGHSVTYISGCLGSANTASENMIAVFFQTTYQLEGYGVEVHSYHIRVFHKDGVLVSQYDFPKDSKIDPDSAVLLDDVEGDGTMRLILMNYSELIVFEVDKWNEGMLDIDYSLPDTESFPRYQQPAVDLWDGINS